MLPKVGEGEEVGGPLGGLRFESSSREPYVAALCSDCIARRRGLRMGYSRCSSTAECVLSHSPVAVLVGAIGASG